MSYDLCAFSPKSGEDPLQTAQRLMEGQEDEPVQRERSPEAEAGKKRLAEALISRNPAFSPFSLQYDEIARFEQITVAEAMARYRYIELNGPEDGPGIQITLFDDQASLTVPYWHQRPKAEAVFREIWGYLEVMEQVAGYRIFDPQLEHVLNLQQDFEQVLSSYAKVTESLQQRHMTPFKAPMPKKPWWRFW